MSQVNTQTSGKPLDRERQKKELIVVCDNREQLPFDLAPYKMIPGTLKTGDYSIAGFENEITIERKSLDDLIMCIGRERERFEKCVTRLLGFRYRSLICE